MSCGAECREGASVDWEPPWASSTRSCTPARAASSSRWRSIAPESSARSSPRWRRAPTTSCARSPARGASSSTRSTTADKKQEHLDDLLPEAFAAVREAGKRVLGQRHFDVQVMGGAALHFGWVAEMKTGEGKTLVATLPVVPQRARRPRRAPRHGERLPRPARRRVDGPAPPLPRARGRHRSSPTTRRPDAEARAVRLPTSPTARTTSSASTTSATTWSSRRGAGAARQRPAVAALLRDRRRGRLDPHRRGPHAAHHLGPRRRRGRALLPVRPRS